MKMLKIRFKFLLTLMPAAQVERDSKHTQIPSFLSNQDVVAYNRSAISETYFCLMCVQELYCPRIDLIVDECWGSGRFPLLDRVIIHNNVCRNLRGSGSRIIFLCAQV